MEVRHLELLRELRDRGTLGAVAQATFRTPSALSQQLRTAERELGVALTEPASRGLRLTWAGQMLADGADDVLGAIAALQARLDAGRGEASGTVRIGTLPSAGAALLPGVLARVAGSLLEIELEDFDCAEAEYAEHTADVDLVIGHSLLADVPLGAEKVFTRVIAREPIDVAVPADHALASRTMLMPADVVGEPWVAVPEAFPFDTVLKAIEAATGERARRIVRIRDNRLVESLVAEGLGIAMLPRFSTPPSEAYRLIPLEGVHAVRSIVALARHDRVRRRAVTAVLEMLEEAGRAL